VIDAVVHASLHNKLMVLLFALALGVGGLLAFQELTIEAFPDPTDTQVQVITRFDGQPTEEVERRVSLPVERALNGTPHLVRARSISLFGLSFVTLTFDDGIVPHEARQLVLERLREADLPDGVTPELGPLATPIGEVYRYTLAGSADPMTLRTLQDWTVRPALLQVAGVAEVVSYGGLLQEIHVEPDPRRLAALGLTLQDVFDALGTASANASGGYVERGAETFVIRSLGVFRDLTDIQDTLVAHVGGVPVLLRDVAQVLVGWAPRQGVVSREDDNDAIEGIVLMRRGENPTRVLDALRSRVDALNQRGLPDDVRLVPFYDRTELVDTTLHTVFKNLAEGALLVVLVLFAFTLSVRASLIVATVIPLSLAAAFVYLRARGMSANLLSMGAVDFGIIVDGSSTAPSSSSSTSSTASPTANPTAAWRIASSTPAARSPAPRSSPSSSSSPPGSPSSPCSASRAASSRRWPTPSSAPSSAPCSSASPSSPSSASSPSAASPTSRPHPS